METLPDEMLIMIFRNFSVQELLTNLRLVCSRWKKLIERRALCVKRKSDLKRAHRSTSYVQILTKTVPLKLFLIRASLHIPYLRELTIYAPNPLGPEHLRPLAGLKHLEHLDVFMQGRVLREDALPVLLNLKSLVVNDIIGRNVLAPLAGCQLRRFCMYGRAQYYPPREMLTFLRGAHGLSELVLRCNELQDAAYETIAACCPRLRALQLYSCWLLTGGAAQSVARLPLRRLHLAGLPLVRPAALALLLGRLRGGLEELALSASCFGNEHVAPLVAAAPRLRVLELWSCRLSPAGAVALAAALPALRFLDLDVTLQDPLLRKLDEHPSLETLRCCTRSSVSEIDLSEYKMSKVKLISTDQRYKFKYFRSRGEGYRASLYYYWTQDALLKPLNDPNVFAFDSDDDYY